MADSVVLPRFKRYEVLITRVIAQKLQFLVAPPAKLRNASLSSVSEFFVLADSAELPIR